MECGTKIRHATRDEAFAHIKSLVWKNEVNDESERSKGLTVYPCGQCGAWHVGHQQSAPLVWHYTVNAHLDAILKADALKPPKPRRLSGARLKRLRPEYRERLKDFEEPNPLLWFSRNTEWEHSVLKFNRTRIIDGRWHEQGGRRWTEIDGQGLLRFGVPSWCAKLRWSDYLALNPTSRDVRDQMAKRGNPTEWLATDDAVPLSVVQAIEVYFRGSWCPVAGVSPEEFDRYIAERPAVYAAAEESLRAKLEEVYKSGVAQSFEVSEAEHILYQDWKQGDAGTVRAHPVRVPHKESTGI